MIQIRRGIFETNSSSTHAICIAKKGDLSIPSDLYFEADWYGRKPEPPFLDVHMRASYLWTCLTDGITDPKDKKMTFCKNYIFDTLAKHGCIASFDESMRGGVDDYDVAEKLIAYVLRSEKNLLNYLFNPLSFVLVGGDEYEECDDYPEKINMPYPHDEIIGGF